MIYCYPTLKVLKHEYRIAWNAINFSASCMCSSTIKRFAIETFFHVMLREWVNIRCTFEIYIYLIFREKEINLTLWWFPPMIPGRTDKLRNWCFVQHSPKPVCQYFILLAAYDGMCQGLMGLYVETTFNIFTNSN